MVVTVVPEPGFALDGPGTFTIVFDAAVEQVAVAVPDLGVAPSHGSTPGTCTTIPAVEGVRFFVGGHEVQPGTYSGTGPVVVTVVADDGYELSGPATLTFDLGRVRSVVGGTPVRPGGSDQQGGTGGGTQDGTRDGGRDGEVRDGTVAGPVREGSLASTGAGPEPVLAASTLLMAAGVVLLAGSRRRAARG